MVLPASGDCGEDVVEVSDMDAIVVQQITERMR